MTDPAPTPEPKREWAVVLPDGTTAPLRDIPWDVISATAKEMADHDEVAVSWSTLVLAPLYSLRAAKTLYRTVCKLERQKPDDDLTTRELYDRFELVDAPDEPDPIEGKTQYELELPDGTKVRLWDLSEKVVNRLAEETSTFWMNVVDDPLGGPGHRATAIYEYLCRRAELEPAEGLTVREFTALWARIPDDKPTSFTDGLPAPKAAEPSTD